MIFIPLGSPMPVGDQTKLYLYLLSQLKARLVLAGKYIPTISKKIHDVNPTADLKINLKGLGIGSGLMSPIDSLYYSKYLYEVMMCPE